jgi:pterin-4a-carbinolamine dehydratase
MGGTGECDDECTGREDLHAMPGQRATADRREGEAYRVQAPEWALQDEATRIERTYRFRSFGDAFAFVRGAGELAEAEFHHPDKMKGLHENDFIMAVKFDGLAGKIAVADKQIER